MKDYLHEIPKEILTVNNIKQDIKNKHKINIVLVLLLMVLSALITCLVIGLWDESKIVVIFYGAGGSLLFISGVILLFLPLIGRRITSRKLVIVEDWLVEIKEGYERRGRRHREYYELRFAKGSKYRLYPEQNFNENYKWSKMYNMTDKGIYNYSQIDDDFYLVFSNEKKNNLLLIYNKKLFDFKDI